MTQFGALDAAPPGRHPQIRPAYRILARAHASVKALFDAVELIDDGRRARNSTRAGRASSMELDVLRSAIVFTSAGLDASMKRLVNDVGHYLIPQKDSAARKQYTLYLKQELNAPKLSEGLRDAILHEQIDEQLLSHYLAVRTKASFQGSEELKKRVQNTLGIPNSDLKGVNFAGLDQFFIDRNKIAHDMDLKDPSSQSLAREDRNQHTVAQQCTEVFQVAVVLIDGAASACQHARRSPT